MPSLSAHAPARHRSNITELDISADRISTDAIWIDNRSIRATTVGWIKLEIQSNRTPLLPVIRAHGRSYLCYKSNYSLQVISYCSRDIIEIRSFHFWPVFTSLQWQLYISWAFYDTLFSPIFLRVKGMKTAQMFFEDCVGSSKNAI